MAYATETRAVGATLVERIGTFRAAMADRMAKYTLYRSTLNELQGLNDRDLADLGIARADIQDLAREAAWGK
jgi:uncharacterized protein YjiS (DUF1127 family)